MTGSVAVYNLGGQEILSHVSVKHAMTMIWRGVARILVADENETIAGFEKPRALELVRYHVAKWKYARTGAIPFSRKGVLVRDNYTCCYCGKHGDTVDHVMPKWAGNHASWTNSVAACFDCNQKKGGRSPKEAGMTMLYTPRIPTFEEAYQYTKRS